MTRGRFISLLCIVSAVLLSSCSMMHQDLSDCPSGLYLSFKYDFNLERADMFGGHVGEVCVYVYDENGRFVTKRQDSGLAGYSPFESPLYQMKMDLPDGKYRFLVLAWQRPFNELISLPGAKFIPSEPRKGDRMEDMEILLETGADGVVENEGVPLDTLWHGLVRGQDDESAETVEVSSACPSYRTVSLVRDTKRIGVHIRDDEPQDMTIDRFDMRIVSRNSHILWDNSLDESKEVTYTPYAMWDTADRGESTDGGGNPVQGGKTGHAEFMTSRILSHEDYTDDDRLIVTNTETGVKVIDVGLADMLAGLAGYDDAHRYSAQEFLDRGYDYDLTFFLVGDKWQYVQVEISILGWSKRIMATEL